MRPVSSANRKTIGAAVLLVAATYWIFSASRKHFEAQQLLPNVRPATVWNYVADFSNMPMLNPTILKFAIITESGHHHHWLYSVRYTEKLSHWPHWTNEAVAHIAVKRLLANGRVATAADHPDNLRYVIESQHETCFFHDLYCLHAFGTFEFEEHGSGTLCRESVSYQCPPFMGAFCRTEVEFQRRAIMLNLTRHFAANRL